jgi:phosphoglycerate dehydrogenase-like enzyme
VNALRPQSRELAGKVIGYVGMGRIGLAAARRFRAFETSGLYFDPVVTLDAQTETTLGLQKTELNTLLQTADIITLHVPLTAETKHLINTESLATLKTGAILINTARGPLVDEAALAIALKSGAVSGAGLDVFEQEPPNPRNPLLAMNNTVVTPHISAGTIDAFETKMSAVFANLHRFFAGHSVENEIQLS